MSIQISTHIDEATKQRFDKICEAQRTYLS